MKERNLGVSPVVLAPVLVTTTESIKVTITKRKGDLKLVEEWGQSRQSTVRCVIAHWSAPYVA